MFKNIKYIFCDIDGVLTDGKVCVDVQGNEQKQICYRDLDAIGIGRKAGIEFAFITGEDTDLAKWIVKRFNVQLAVFGAKDKLGAVQALIAELQIEKDFVCYIGDSNRDAAAMGYVAVGAVPADGTPKAIAAADFITKTIGGMGVLFEVVEYLVDHMQE